MASVFKGMIANRRYFYVYLYEKKIKEGDVLELNEQKGEREKPIFIKTRARNVTLEQNDILYIESRAKKVVIHTKSDTIEAYAAIGELEKQMNDSFYRCHRGYLVNLAFVAEYNNSTIILNNGESIILVKEKYSEFVKIYMQYLKNQGAIFL